MNAATLVYAKSVLQGTKCDTILTPLPRYVIVAMAKKFESSAPLL
jgi:hypothetical protein